MLTESMSACRHTYKADSSPRPPPLPPPSSSSSVRNPFLFCHPSFQLFHIFLKANCSPVCKSPHSVSWHFLVSFCLLCCTLLTLLPYFTPSLSSSFCLGLSTLGSVPLLILPPYPLQDHDTSPVSQGRITHKAFRVRLDSTFGVRVWVRTPKV